MTKSLFLKLSEFKGNPIDEYIKIEEFMHRKVNGLNDFYYFFDLVFPYCNLLNGHYTNFEKCINDNVINLIKNKNTSFIDLDENSQEICMSDFINYAEIILYSINIFTKKYRNLEYKVYYQPNTMLFVQLNNLIKTSLESMCLNVYSNENNGEIKIIKKNCVAEVIASQSSFDIKDSIIEYLSINKENLKERRRVLLELIDSLEQTMSNFSKCNVISSIKMYSQLLRHPELNKSKGQYKWFYQKENEYLDDLFLMVLFVQQYKLTKEIVNKFDKKTNQNN